MKRESSFFRRILGITCLAIPIAMLVMGETVLKRSLDGIAFLIYWLICFLLTSAAMGIALWDIREVRRQTRALTRELIVETFTKAGDHPVKNRDISDK